MLFSAFSTRRLQAKRCFSYFLHFAHERRVIFSIFRSSKGLAMRFSAFFSFPRGWKCSLRHFSVFPSLGKPFFAVFQSSQIWESYFLSFFVLPKFGKGDFSHFLVFPILGMYFPLIFDFLSWRRIIFPATVHCLLRTIRFRRQPHLLIETNCFVFINISFSYG